MRIRSVVGVGEERVEAGEGVGDGGVGVHGGAVVAERTELFVAECVDEEAGGLAAGFDDQAGAVGRSAGRGRRWRVGVAVVVVGAGVAMSAWAAPWMVAAAFGVGVGQGAGRNGEDGRGDTAGG